VPYDFETGTDRIPTPPIVAADRRDLEAIVSLLELAAICLTDTPASDFTAEELIAEARRIGGPEIELDEGDVRIVLAAGGLLKKAPKGRLRLK
jgi:hypothetical protein